MKKICLFFLMICLIIFSSGCAPKKQNNLAEEKVKPVKIQKAKEETRQVTMDYIGLVNAGEIKKYSFKTPGKIEKIFFEKGKAIKKGEVLAKLDTEDLAFSVQAAKAQMEAAQAQYEKAVIGATQEEIRQAEINVEKARDSYNFVLDSFERIEKLFEKGSVSQQDLDKAKLELQLTESSLKQAELVEQQVKKGSREQDKKAFLAQLEQAKIDYAYKQNLLSGAEILSDIDGYIVDIQFKEAEMVSAGYPVVIVRGGRGVINVGLSQKDAGKVHIGTDVKINIDGVETEGRISNIAQVPDMQSRTYNAEIEFSEGTEQDKILIGSIARLKIHAGEEKGIWMPISCIMAGIEDYVYIVVDGKAIKKNIIRENVQGSNVMVANLRDGEQVVIEGMKELNDGDRVSIEP